MRLLPILILRYVCMYLHHWWFEVLCHHRSQLLGCKYAKDHSSKSDRIFIKSLNRRLSNFNLLGPRGLFFAVVSSFRGLPNSVTTILWECVAKFISIYETIHALSASHTTRSAKRIGRTSKGDPCGHLTKRNSGRAVLGHRSCYWISQPPQKTTFG